MGRPLSEFVPLTDYEARESKAFRLRFPGTPFVYQVRPQNALAFVRLWTAKNHISAEIEAAAMGAHSSKTPGLARLELTAAIYRAIGILWEIRERGNPITDYFFKRFFYRFMARNIDLALETWEKVLAHSGRLLRFNSIPPGLRTNSDAPIYSDWARNFFSGSDPDRETWISILGRRELEKESAISQFWEMEAAKEGRKNGKRK